MNRLVSTLTRLMRLRGGPQDFPDSLGMTIVLVTAYLLLSLVIGQQFKDEGSAARSLLALCLQVVILAGLLNWRRVPERFAQTLSALVGVGIVFSLISWVLLAQADPAVNQPSLAIVWFGVLIWSLVVDANIYRHALSVTLSAGVLITVLIFAVSYTLIEILFLGVL